MFADMVLRRRFSLAVAVFLIIPFTAALGQPADRLHGTVRDAATGLPLPGVHVFIDGTSIGAVTDRDGSFELRQLEPGAYTLVARFVGFETQRQDVMVPDDHARPIELALRPATAPLDELVVTAIGERQLRAEVAATVHAIGPDDIRRSMPVHPSEVMSRLPGVWINTTSGEGHMTSIRQPLTTEPVYLFLENGVPTRSTGFFNHNALYETNVPMADGVEVLKGPGTALYGSDAIGGVINVRPGAPYDAPTAEISAESGSFGFGRLLLSTGTEFGPHALRIDVNATRSDGWRDESRYDRQSAALMATSRLGSRSTLRTLASLSFIDQQPAGSSALREDDFRNTPERNYTPISFRDVHAFRVSSAFEHARRLSLVSITPYFRYNEMSILPNWSLAYDPTVYDTWNHSLGMLARVRRDVEGIDLRLVGGLDLEVSPGGREERIIIPERAEGIFTDYSEGELAYDYDVTFRQAAPYLHAEYKPVPHLQLTAGVRADLLGYDYENHLDVVTTGPHRRAASTSRSFAHLSPKLGASYRIGTSNIFAAYRHAFRVPSEGQLFRQGLTTNALDLEPVKADNFEVGVRMFLGSRISVESSVYLLRKTDDVVTFTDDNGVRVSTNAGKTSHRGIETGLLIQPIDGLSVTASHSYTVHRFDEWTPSTTADFSGKEMDAAPRTIAFLGLSYDPGFVQWLHLSADVSRLGSYWMNPENTVKYDGHVLLNVQASVDLPQGFEAFGRINNVTDERYAELASYHDVRGEEYAPGRPRAFFVGLRYHISGGASR